MNATFKTLALAAALFSSAVAVPTAVRAADPTSFSVNAVCVPSTMKLKVFVKKETTSPLTVKLKNASGDVLFEETVGKRESGKAIAFNLSQLSDGVYTVEVSSDGQTVSKTVNLATPERQLAVR